MSQRSARGFIVLEMIVFLAAIAVVIGVAVPVLGGGDRLGAIEQARLEMDRLQRAVTAYFRDAEAFPASLGDLVTKPAGTQEWMGPYVQKDFLDLEASSLGWRYDPWRTLYQLVTVSATQRKIRSFGPNRTNDSGGGDDIDVLVDSNPILWEITKEELLVINRAILRYNDVEAPPWLSHEYTACLNRLQAKGFLPIGAPPKFDYRYDAWGQWYATVGSPTIAAATSGPP
jgi:general secretion pathway protein G